MDEAIRARLANRLELLLRALPADERQEQMAEICHSLNEAQAADWTNPDPSQSPRTFAMEAVGYNGQLDLTPSNVQRAMIAKAPFDLVQRVTPTFHDR